MLAKSLVEEIARLLAEGKLSQRKIAQKLGISRGTVNNIAHGRRGLHGREPEDALYQSVEFVRPVRCEECGAMVAPPCIACQARAYRERNRRLASCHHSAYGDLLPWQSDSATSCRLAPAASAQAAKVA